MIRSKLPKKHNPKFKIRNASLKDLDLLVVHRRGMFRDMGYTQSKLLDQQDKAYRKWARTRLIDGSLVGFVTTHLNRPVASGCVWIQPKQPGVMTHLLAAPYLLSVYTEPSHRRLGLASEITRKAIKWCRQKGYSEIILHASIEGRKVYPKLGFQRTWEMRLKLK
jgi:GNAT superfamily N-acetyltransferase